RELVLTSVYNELNPQINEFNHTNQFIQQPPFIRSNHIGSFHLHPYYTRPVQYPQQPLTFNGP
ncbi:7594_t:CDS:1, partial [Dentiscutata heterogama]